LILVALYPNSTHILQPLDVGVFGPLKSRWKKIVKQWRVDNEKEVSKFEVPTALSQIIYDKEMASNIKSGFRATGIYPYNADNVDYSKIIIRTVPEHDTLINAGNIKCHLQFVESKIKKIDVNLLDEFKRTKRGHYEWDGNENATILFTLWSQIMDDVNNPENEITTDITTPTPTPTSTTSSSTTTTTTKTTTSTTITPLT